MRPSKAAAKKEDIDYETEIETKSENDNETENEIGAKARLKWLYWMIMYMNTYKNIGIEKVWRTRWKQIDVI